MYNPDIVNIGYTRYRTNTNNTIRIRVITKLPNTEQSSKRKVKTHKSTNRQISQQPENWENHTGHELVQVFLKK